MLIYCLGDDALKNGYFLRTGKEHLNEIIARNRVIFLFSLFYASLILMQFNFFIFAKKFGREK